MVPTTGFQRKDDVGYIDRKKPAIEVSSIIQWTKADIISRSEQYITDLRDLETAFNIKSTTMGLGVQMDITPRVREIENGNYDAVYQYYDDSGYGGRLYLNQLHTALDAFKKMIENPQQSGLILGALQSGKTGTSLAIQFFGPIYYLLTGVKIYPLYLVTSLTSHELQTKLEFERFLQFYGNVKFVYESRSCTIIDTIQDASNAMISGNNPVLPLNPELDVKFEMHPTLKIYREQVLNGAVEDFRTIRTEDFIKRRVHGKSIDETKNFISSMKDKGFHPVIIIDENQHGASDRIVEDKITGKKESRPCVLKQLLQGLQDVIGTEARIICLSATPFDTSDLSSFWQVKQYLDLNYVGFNMFKGAMIDGTVPSRVPNVFNFEDVGKEYGVPFMRYVNGAMYLKIMQGTIKDSTWLKWVNEINYPYANSMKASEGEQRGYARRVENAVRSLILNIAKQRPTALNGKATGICLRLFNDNKYTEKFLDKISIPTSEIEVVRFFNDNSGTVKEALNRRVNKNIPFLIMVTSKARMGDSFPAEVEFFGEFAQEASDLNSLLQGLLGRACGVRKNSTVFMSYANEIKVLSYIRENGLLRGKASPHAVNIGITRRAKPTGMIKLSENIVDQKVKEFLDWINNKIVPEWIDQSATNKNGSPRLLARRVKKNNIRLENLLQEDLFVYIEKNAAKLFPTIFGDIIIARHSDKVVDKFGKTLTYHQIQTSSTMECEFSFRSSEKGGRSGRGNGPRDSRTDRSRSKHYLQPQINMHYVDAFGNPATAGNGTWKAWMVTYPLLKSVTEYGAPISEALPSSGHALEDRMTDEETVRRNESLAQRSRK